MEPEFRFRSGFWLDNLVLPPEERGADRPPLNKLCGAVGDDVLGPTVPGGGREVQLGDHQGSRYRDVVRILLRAIRL